MKTSLLKIGGITLVFLLGLAIAVLINPTRIQAQQSTPTPVLKCSLPNYWNNPTLLERAMLEW